MLKQVFDREAQTESVQHDTGLDFSPESGGVSEINVIR